MLLDLVCASQFLVKFQAFTINDSKGICDEVCFQFQAATAAVFNKAQCLYHK